jgi:hypothetical protein
MPSAYRTVVHELAFDSEFEALEPDPFVRETLISSVDSTLSRRPEKGYTIDNVVFRKELSDPSRKRRFALFYTFTDTTVILLSIRKLGQFEM